MCFFIPPRSKNGKKKDRKTRCAWGASSSTTSSTRSHPSAQQEHRYVQESKSRDYEGVFEDIKHVDALKTKLVPPPPPPVDVPKMVADALATQEQQRKEKERDTLYEKMVRDLKERDERLEKEAKAREKRERKDREERERREREVVKAAVDPNVQAMMKMFEDDRKAREESEKRERERKEWKKEGRMEALGWLGGAPPAGLPTITYGAYNNGMYANNGLPAPASQALLGWTGDNIEEWQKRIERKTDNRLKAMEDDQDDFKRQALRSLQQRGGYGQFRSAFQWGLH